MPDMLPNNTDSRYIMPIDIVYNNPSVSPHHRYTQEEFDKFAQPIDVTKPIEAILY